jgi:hypothetical protein
MFDKIKINQSVVVIYCCTTIFGTYKAFKKVETVGDDFFIVGGVRFRKYDGLAVNNTSIFAPQVLSILKPRQ